MHTKVTFHEATHQLRELLVAQVDRALECTASALSSNPEHFRERCTHEEWLLIVEAFTPSGGLFSSCHGTSAAPLDEIAAQSLTHPNGVTTVRIDEERSRAERDAR